MATTEPPEDNGSVEQAPTSAALDRLLAAMPDAVVESEFQRGAPVARIEPARLLEVMTFLRDDPACRFDLLSSLCGMDQSLVRAEGERFDVVYHLYSVEHRHVLTVKAAVAEGGEAPSVTGIWLTANWHEREAFDMFGIGFAGHPDLRRILMPDEFDAFPLRKDFPLEGREKDHGYWRQPGDDDRNTYVAEQPEK
jgi:NADH-quinone oxidoreductase subunit C